MSGNRAIGSLWRHKTSQGKAYLSGELEIDGTKHKVVVFKNDYKEQEKHPDYRIYPQKRQVEEDEF